MFPELNISCTASIIKNQIKKRSSQRFVELDILRGVAILLMIFFHALWDLDFFEILSLNSDIYAFQKIAPIMFFLLLGTCLMVSKNQKAEQTVEQQKKYTLHLILRGLKIFSLGMMITIVTILFMPDRPIIFGVLHCLGVSIILSIPFLQWKTVSKILLSAGIMIAGYIFSLCTFSHPSAIHLAFGFHQKMLWDYTIDYFPIFPWFGVCLLGTALADILYAQNKRRFPIPDLSKIKPFTAFSWLGRHSLTVYIIHQPIIAGILFLFILL